MPRDPRTFTQPLPCWVYLSDEEYRRRVAELVAEIDDEGAQRRRDENKRSLGAKKILRQDPHHWPKKKKRTPQPRFHARNPEVCKRMWEAWREIVSAFREATARLFAGERNVAFPEGTIPPHLPFVPFSGAMPFSARGQPA